MEKLQFPSMLSMKSLEREANPKGAQKVVVVPATRLQVPPPDSASPPACCGCAAGRMASGKAQEQVHFVQQEFSMEFARLRTSAHVLAAQVGDVGMAA
jgi:hypothetical protein